MTAAVTAPGLYPSLDYHAPVRHTPTRALTYSGIKILLDATPLDFITPRVRKSKEMDFGSVVHALALDKGAKFVVSPYDDYRTKDARAWRDEISESGQIPIKPDHYADAEAMAKIIKAKITHALKGAPYQTEVPFFWQEGDTWCSGMADVWCDSLSIVIDPKVTPYIHPAKAAAHMYNMGWPLQNAWYRRGLETIYPERAGRIRFTNLLIHPDEPFTSRLIDISEAWRHTSERECLRALRIFDRCMAADEWPGYPDQIEMLEPPGWVAARAMEAEMAEEMETEDEIA